MSGVTLSEILWVGGGGLAGSVLRYLVSGWAHRLAPATTFPLGTLTVNVGGCLMIGLVAGVAETRQVGLGLRLFLLIGVLGGFTTFSSFGYETFALLRDGEIGRAAGNAVFQVVGGLAAVWLGFSLSRLW